MRKVWGLVWVLVLGLGLVGLAQAASLELHGEFGAKVQTTSNAGILTNDDGLTTRGNLLTQSNGNHWEAKVGERVGVPGNYVWVSEGGVTVDSYRGHDLDDTWASAQFRLWAVAQSDDGKVKGVWAMEVGSANFGNGLGLHNESTNIESRMMYLDFALPFAENLGLRMRAGLSPYYVNRFLWNETAPGIDLSGTINLGSVPTTFVFVWVRALDNVDLANNNDFDAYAAVLAFDLSKALGVDKANAKLFYIPLNNSQADDQPWYLGGDAQFKVAGVDVDLGLIYQGGEREVAQKDRDYDAWLAYADLGYQLTEQLKASFLWWWASGDDDPTGDIENYLAVDTHTFGSVVLFEDGAFDDGYVVSRHPYLNNLGFQMYRLRVDYQATPKLSLAAAVNYMKFDEDAYWRNNAGQLKHDDDIGWELDVYAKYQLYKDLTLDVAAGYLWAGDGLDAWAVKNVTVNPNTGDVTIDRGDADDMYRVSVGVTYTF